MGASLAAWSLCYGSMAANGARVARSSYTHPEPRNKSGGTTSPPRQAALWDLHTVPRFSAHGEPVQTSVDYHLSPSYVLSVPAMILVGQSYNGISQRLRFIGRYVLQ